MKTWIETESDVTASLTPATQRGAMAAARSAYERLYRGLVQEAADERAASLLAKVYERGRHELRHLDRMATDVNLSVGATDAFDSFMSGVESADWDARRAWLSMLPEAMQEIRRDAPATVAAASPLLARGDGQWASVTYKTSFLTSRGEVDVKRTNAWTAFTSGVPRMDNWSTILLNQTKWSVGHLLIQQLNLDLGEKVTVTKRPTQPAAAEPVPEPRALAA